MLAYRKQQGAALFIALVILVIISVLGVTSLRSSSTDARVVTNVQAAAHSFQAAESAINEIISVMETKKQDSDSYGRIVSELVENRNLVLKYCVTENGVKKNTDGDPVSASCAADDFFDSKEIVQASARVGMQGNMVPEAGWSLNSPVTFGRAPIIVVGEGDVPSLKVKKINVQKLGLFGLMNREELTLNN